jgi:hypothetical protein
MRTVEVALASQRMLLQRKFARNINVIWGIQSLREKYSA